MVVVGASWAASGSGVVRALGARVPAVGVGVTGQRLAGWLPDALRAVAGRRLVLVLEMGGNGAPTAEQVTAAHRALTAAAAPGAVVLWALPPRWPTGSDEQRRVARLRTETTAALIAARVPLVRGVRHSAKAADLRDYAHLNNAGAVRFVEQLYGEGISPFALLAGAVLLGAGVKAVVS